MFAALSYDEGETWPVRKLLTPGSGHYEKCGGWTGNYTATPPGRAGWIYLHYPDTGRRDSSDLPAPGITASIWPG